MPPGGLQGGLLACRRAPVHAGLWFRLDWADWARRSTKAFWETPWLEVERGGLRLSSWVEVGLGVEAGLGEGTGEGVGVPSEVAQAALNMSRASGMMLTMPP